MAYEPINSKQCPAGSRALVCDSRHIGALSTVYEIHITQWSELAVKYTLVASGHVQWRLKSNAPYLIEVLPPCERVKFPDIG